MLNSDEVKEAIDVLDEIISEIEAMQTTEGSETERLVSTSLSSMYDAQKHLRALHIALTTEA